MSDRNNLMNFDGGDENERKKMELFKRLLYLSGKVVGNDVKSIRFFEFGQNEGSFLNRWHEIGTLCEDDENDTKDEPTENQSSTSDKSEIADLSDNLLRDVAPGEADMAALEFDETPAGEEFSEDDFNEDELWRNISLGEESAEDTPDDAPRGFPEDGRPGSDSDEGDAFIRKLLNEAREGSPNAVCLLAAYTLCGFHVKKSTVEGIALFGVAASMGSPCAMQIVEDMEEEGRITCGVDECGSIFYLEATEYDEDFDGDESDALGWAEFRISLGYLTGEALFKSVGDAEKWEDRASARGCCLNFTYENLIYRYEPEADRMLRRFDKAIDAESDDDDKRRLCNARDGLEAALDELTKRTYDLFDTPTFMNCFVYTEWMYSASDDEFNYRMEEADNILRDIGGDDGDR